MSWGLNLTTTRVRGLEMKGSSLRHIFSPFNALLGVEYVVHVQATNYWGQKASVEKTFLHPEVQLLADGTFPHIHLPDMLSTSETNVAFSLLIQPGTFMSINRHHVLGIRTVDRTIRGEVDPCEDNSKFLQCTYMNFHIHVPGSLFIAFQKPIRIELMFGAKGWPWNDPGLVPELQYWETLEEEWRPAANSCPAGVKSERWNVVHKIYTVTVCHLTQFTVFEVSKPVGEAAAEEVASRPTSNTDMRLPMTLFGVTLLGAFVCAVGYMCVLRRFIKNLAKADCAVNKRLEISKFNFKFPRARNYEIIGLVLGCIEAKFCK